MRAPADPSHGITPARTAARIDMQQSTAPESRMPFSVTPVSPTHTFTTGNFGLRVLNVGGFLVYESGGFPKICPDSFSALMFTGSSVPASCSCVVASVYSAVLVVNVAIPVFSTGTVVTPSVPVPVTVPFARFHLSPPNTSAVFIESRSSGSDGLSSASLSLPSIDDTAAITKNCGCPRWSPPYMTPSLFTFSRILFSTCRFLMSPMRVSPAGSCIPTVRSEARFCAKTDLLPYRSRPALALSPNSLQLFPWCSVNTLCAAFSLVILSSGDPFSALVLFLALSAYMRISGSASCCPPAAPRGGTFHAFPRVPPRPPPRPPPLPRPRAPSPRFPPRPAPPRPPRPSAVGAPAPSRGL